MALNILNGFDLGNDRNDPEVWHKMIEAMKLAFIDTRKYVADPRFMKTKVEDMLSERYASERRALIGDTALYPVPGNPSGGDTVYFCTADDKGNMVSWIQSNYKHFGSGIVVPGTSIALQDRAMDFSMDPESDNFVQGGKRSYHTIIPGFLCKDGKPIGPFGVMGGYMQPQGHLMVVVNTVDFHMNPQEALDCPRFQWVGEKKVQLEREAPVNVGLALAAKGHQVEILNSNLLMGRGQIIWRTEDGMLCGGTESRSDGSICVF
jgi:gamma-glutamyltranspeptidase/glutathione hydrolase